MKPDSLVDTGVKMLGLRFVWVSLAPAGLLALLVGGLLASGAPAASPDLALLIRRITALGLSEALALLLSVVVLALLLHPLQLGLVRLLEGYWPSWLETTVGERLRCRHRRRRERLEQQSQRLDLEPSQISPRDRGAMEAAARALLRFYPARERVLPTALGNILRGAEDAPARRYGLEAAVLWPRLYPLLPARLAAVLDDQRNQLDASVNFCVAFLMTAGVSSFLLRRHGAWLLVSAGCLVLAWLAHRAAIAAALAYGEGIQAAFDLHRFDLLSALRMPLPADRQTERCTNEALSTFLLQGAFVDGQGRPVDVRYEHRRAAIELPREAD